jgi:L-rhamnose mutarotase
MANQRLQHDAAIAIAKACLDVIAPYIPPELHKQAWQSFYEVAKAGIEAYEIHVDRMQHRLHPSRN